MVGQGEPPTEKTVEEIARETEEALACAARLEQEATRKRHNGQQDDSGSSYDGAGDGTRSAGHHPNYNHRRPTSQNRLRDRSWSICEEIDRIKYQGEQVYRMLAHNALDSRMIIDQLGPLLPKDNENVNAPPGHARCSYHGEPTPECGDRRQGQDPDHRQSSRRESASSITLPKECD
jgi:hypothetical protein